MKQRILITGGHLTPALAVIEQLPKKEWDIVYVGRKYALEGDDALSAEYTTITVRNIHFRPLRTGRLQRSFTIYTIGSMIKIFRGLRESFNIVKEVQPAVVLSFGGYVALPIALSAWILGVPVVTHEQTMQPGLTNRIIGRFARFICVSYPHTVKFFPQHKTVCTGNPLRASLFKDSKGLPISSTAPLLYITGGSLGSQSINSAVMPILGSLLERFAIIHQCGGAQNNQDYKNLQKSVAMLPKALRDRYYVVPFIDPQHIGWILRTAAVVIGRSGANTITELIAFAKPSVLIPLPWSAGGEQLRHAQFLNSRGGALVLPQNTLHPAALEAAINQVFTHRNSYKEALARISIPKPSEAAHKIIELLARAIPLRL